MWGAIIGDIAGSTLEFANNRVKPETLFPKDSYYTDDTVLTVATAEWFNGGRTASIDAIYRRYAGHDKGHAWGNRFRKWLADPSMGPYGSRGNGAPMRVSPCGLVLWARGICYAADTAEVTHNTPEGIVSAQMVSHVIAAFLHSTPGGLRTVDDYLHRLKPGYTTLAGMRRTNQYSELAYPTVAAALMCVKDSTGFQDCLKNAVSVGGDADTIGAIAGAMAEARWGLSSDLLGDAKDMLPGRYIQVMDEFYDQFARKGTAFPESLREFKAPKMRETPNL